MFKLHHKRQKRISKSLKNTEVLIIASGNERNRNSDVNYPFRVNSNFYYLTGINTADCIAVLFKDKYILFLPANDKNKELWLGKTLTAKEAITNFAVDKTHTTNTINKVLPQLLKNITTIHYNIDENIVIDKLINNQQKTIIPLKNTVEKMRVIKDKEEIKLMEQAAQISIKAHKQAMREVKNCTNEAQIAAIFDYQFTYNNSTWAYPHIVASGQNACVLHYTNNNAEIKNGDLLLIDAGCEVCGYASDITRTFPVNGRFNKEQKEIYNLVLLAQKNAIEIIKPNILITDLHKTVVKTLTTGLVELGLLIGSVEDNIKNSKYMDYFKHGTGHFLGLDVHDVGDYKSANKPQKLKQGMVMTIEPGIYITANKNIDKKWWNIGVRIEDDILVTKNSYQNLTQDLVKEINDIEKLMNS